MEEDDEAPKRRRKKARRPKAKEGTAKDTSEGKASKSKMKSKRTLKEEEEFLEDKSQHEEDIEETASPPKLRRQDKP